MTELVAILAVWIGSLGGIALGVVSYNTQSRVGRWPWEYGVGVDDVLGTMTAHTRRLAREYLDGWRTEDHVARRVVAFVLSFGLLYRAMIHNIVAIGVDADRDIDINYGLVWTPIEMARGPRWTARVLTLGSGLCLSVLVGWPVWGWPAWVQWIARMYLFAQVAVWFGEPIAMVQDSIK